MNDRLWSPQMRKWWRDSPQHGKRVMLIKSQGWHDGAGFNLDLERITDDGIMRIIDDGPGAPASMRITDHI